MNRLWVILMLLAPRVAQAEPLLDAVPALTIGEAVAIAIHDNPELVRMRSQWEALQERPAQARALANPMLSYSGMDTVSGGTWPDTGQKRYMIQQDLPGYGKRGLREDVARQDAEILRLELETATWDVVLRVKESAVELLAVRQVIELLREEEGLLRRMEAVAETQYSTGERSQADVLMAQSEVTRLKQRHLEVQARENRLQAQLNILLNRRVDERLLLEDSPPLPSFGDAIDPLLKLADANRPEIRTAQARIQRENLNQRRRTRESAPDYRVGFEYRDLDAGDDMAMFTVGVNLPIWRGSERAGIREAASRQTASRAALEEADQLSRLEVQDTHFRWMTAKRSLELIRTELIPQAESRFQASEAGYRTGQLDFLDLLASERFLLDAKIQAAWRSSEVSQQAARLERAVGATAENPIQEWRDK
jgi:outer membrane protein, heavy metal efflux system